MCWSSSASFPVGVGLTNLPKSGGQIIPRIRRPCTVVFASDFLLPPPPVAVAENSNIVHEDEGQECYSQLYYSSAGIAERDSKHPQLSSYYFRMTEEFLLRSYQRTRSSDPISSLQSKAKALRFLQSSFTFVSVCAEPQEGLKTRMVMQWA